VAIVPQETIHLRNIAYSYPNQESLALNDISLDIATGECLAIMGPTGAGKTTLALLLNGLIPQYYEGQFSGEVQIADFSTQKHTIQELVKHVGLVLQDTETQIFGITVFEDTAFGPSNLGYPREQISELVAAALADVRLSGYEDRLTNHLSGGEMQRLAIAGVLAMQPEVLVLDEPVSELDSHGRLEVLAAIRDLRADNRATVLIVDHSAESVLEMADRVAVLLDGEIAWLGEPKDLFGLVSLMEQFSIRPPTMAQFGKRLFEAGWTDRQDAVLTLDDAEAVVRKLLGGKKFTTSKSNSKSMPAQPRAILEIEALFHTYPGAIEALSGISCTIAEGEFVALIGQNGAGKSTLMKHLNGLLRPTSGVIRINGVDSASMSIHELASQVGYVFQNPDHQIFSMTVEEELRFGLKNLGLSEAEQDVRLQEALEFVGLQDQLQRHPFTLGKGERQKVAVASILAIAPPVICIDEPTTGLDWQGAKAMMDMIAVLHQAGHTIMMITHNLENVAEYAQRVLLVDQGQLRLDGTPAQIFAQTEILRQCHLDPPPISQLVQRLQDVGCPQEICRLPQMVQAVHATMETL
jgi:energy-coupling factor transport system ATP-binding protein